MGMGQAVRHDRDHVRRLLHDDASLPPPGVEIDHGVRIFLRVGDELRRVEEDDRTVQQGKLVRDGGRVADQQVRQVEQFDHVRFARHPAMRTLQTGEAGEPIDLLILRVVVRFDEDVVFIDCREAGDHLFAHDFEGVLPSSGRRVQHDRMVAGQAEFPQQTGAVEFAVQEPVRLHKADRHRAGGSLGQQTRFGETPTHVGSDDEVVIPLRIVRANGLVSE